MAQLAKEIVVDRDENGVPRITINGTPFPYYTAGIITPAPSLKDHPTITLTIPAECVRMVNDASLPPGVNRRNVRYRCKTPGCKGSHTRPLEEC